MENKIESLLDNIFDSINKGHFVKLTLSNYKGQEKDLKNIYVKVIKLKNEIKLNFTYRYKTKDITKNYSIAESTNIFKSQINTENFTIVNLLTTQNDYQLLLNNNGKSSLNKSKSSHIEVVNDEHDHVKHRLISAKSPFLQALNISDKEGVVYKSTQDKYKQINHYIELLAPLIQQLDLKKAVRVVDMGSGKGYLTFALYDYLENSLHIESQVVGVEYRSDLVNLCNEIASNSNFNNLHFIQGSILEYTGETPNILIALHACDTATDDAIFKGIKAEADLIVVAPCCHKQIRREMEKGKAKNDLNFLTNHGIFLERQAEMVTDGLRALILEYFGYTVKIQQFISDAHTPKNVMITAVRNKKAENKKNEILEKIKRSKAYFGIEKHHLEMLLNL